MIVETISFGRIEREQHVLLLTNLVGRYVRHDPILREIKDIEDLL